MDTPICDFVKKYAEGETVRFHMPGHKGKSFLGCEALDITEIKGADSLYEADGIIQKSENNAARLFDTAKTVYSTEGSSQCIRAMLYLTQLNSGKNEKPIIAAGRNAHKTFILAAALLNIEVVWLWEESDDFSLCKCTVTLKQLQKTLSEIKKPVAAVYLTSPDYLGNMSDIKALAKVCHENGTVLMVDNAHGAYLRFLQPSLHPIDLGADICCDSAHKTLPVLTGGAYLHISKNAPDCFAENAKSAMALFGSTSPSYLILQSLDFANKYMFDNYQNRLSDFIKELDDVKKRLSMKGWIIEKSDPLKLTVNVTGHQSDNIELSEKLRSSNIEFEYSDPDYLVLMATPENPIKDFERLTAAMGNPTLRKNVREKISFFRPEKRMSLRSAIFSHQEEISIQNSFGRILASTTISCPPAVPVLVSGEVITHQAIELFKYYKIETVSVVIE